MTSFRSWVTRNWLSILIVAINGLIAALNIINILATSKVEPFGITVNKLNDLQLPLIILTLGIFTIGMLPIRSHVKDIETKVDLLLGNSSFVGISKFRPQRSGYLEPLVDTLNLAKSEVLIVGIGLGVLEGGPTATGLFDDLVKSKKITVRFLLLSPLKSDGQQNPVVEVANRQTNYPMNRDLIERRLREFQTWRAGLPQVSQRRVHLRFYDNIPATGAILVDVNESNGLIRVEPIIPGLGSNKRPSFDVTPSSSRQFYDELRKCYQNLWDEGIDAETILGFLNKTQIP